jgi:murein DD-endopeptidase MepM/ murein hydrolase activator NlpD
VDALGGEVAVLARQQRAAAAASANWSARQAVAVAAGSAAGLRWRAALRASVAVLAHKRAVGPAPSGGASVADAVTLAAAQARLRAPATSDHKRAIAIDHRLDRRLLRLVAAAPPGWPPPRRLDPRQLAPGPLWPISGQLAAAGPDGLAITTDVAQVVSSPVAGRVMFAESFRGFGPLLIIDRGRGYHLVMSGMARLDVRRGASVVAGQSLGEVVARKDGPARLQLELRHRGLPIDPAPWLAAYHDKVRS